MCSNTFSFFIDFNFQNPPSQWCRLATIKCSKAFLALKPLYCDQSTKLTQLIKPNYFVILLYWYSTSSLWKLPHLFLRESLILILCSCLLLNQNISMFWCFFLLNDFQSFFFGWTYKMDMNLLIPEFFFFKRHILASLHFNENLQRETQKAFNGKEYISGHLPKI